ncbi:hypothetical protein AHAS_Ahas01G0205900 [Arachis hypogaea]
MYVMLDREKKSWIMSRLELRHSHTCSAKKAVHYYEYTKLMIHAKCIITNNDETGIRPNKTYLALTNKAWSTLLGCALHGSEEIPNFEWVFTQWVRCVETAPREIIIHQCKAMAGAMGYCSSMMHLAHIEEVTIQAWRLH